MSEGGEETKRIPCNWCGSRTNHILRASYSSTDSWPYLRLDEDDGSDDEIPGKPIKYCIWACAGCNAVTFESFNVEDIETIGYFQPLEETWVRARTFRNLDAKLSSLYSEVFACFQKGSLLLCTIGLRALVEGVCRDKGLTEGNLEDKVNGLVKFLPSLNIIEALHDLRFAGNEAAHKMEALSRDDAGKAIEIMEDLLNFLYDLDYKATQLRSRSKRLPFDSIKSGSVQ